MQDGAMFHAQDRPPVPARNIFSEANSQRFSFVISIKVCFETRKDFPQFVSMDGVSKQNN